MKFYSGVIPDERRSATRDPGSIAQKTQVPGVWLRGSRLALRLAGMTICFVFASAAPAYATDIWSGVFTKEQAKRGEDVFLTHCAAACHLDNLLGNGPAPGLAGPDFMLRWEDFSVAELIEKIRTTMPKAAPASLSAEDYLTVTAYILSANGAAAGPTKMSAGLDKIMITAKK